MKTVVLVIITAMVAFMCGLMFNDIHNNNLVKRNTQVYTSLVNRVEELETCTSNLVMRTYDIARELKNASDWSIMVNQIECRMLERIQQLEASVSNNVDKTPVKLSEKSLRKGK